MDCLVTLNIEEYLCQNARSSLIAAAHRWGVDYVEVTRPCRPDLNAAYTKLTTIDRLNSYARIAYYDADMLIRSDAPNPFQIFDSAELFYAVRDVSRTRFPEGSLQRRALEADSQDRWHPVVEERFKMGISLSDYKSRFFNAGFFLTAPGAHADLFRLLVQCIPDVNSPYCFTGRYEQALLNYVVQASGKLELVDEIWNQLDPDISERRMNAWVYHFTGLNSAQLKNALPDFPWS